MRDPQSGDAGQLCKESDQAESRVRAGVRFRLQPCGRSLRGSLGKGVLEGRQLPLRASWTVGQDR